MFFIFAACSVSTHIKTIRRTMSSKSTYTRLEAIVNLAIWSLAYCIPLLRSITTRPIACFMAVLVFFSSVLQHPRLICLGLLLAGTCLLCSACGSNLDAADTAAPNSPAPASPKPAKPDTKLIPDLVINQVKDDALKKRLREISDDPTKIDDTDQYGWTALHGAVNGDEPAAIDALVKAGADPNVATNFNKRTPLHFAARSGNEDALKKLLSSAKLDPNRLDCDKRTALHWAIDRADMEAIKLLAADNRTDFGIKRDGCTLLEYASNRRALSEDSKKKICKILQDHGAQ